MSLFLIATRMKASLAAFSPGLGLAVGITLLTAACATAPDAQGLASGAGADGKVAETEKLVCHSEKRTGTNFPTKICKTAEQWNELDKKQHGDAYDYTRQVFENGSVTNAKNCGQSGQVASC